MSTAGSDASGACNLPAERDDADEELRRGIERALTEELELHRATLEDAGFVIGCQLKVRRALMCLWPAQ